ncbi:hypothetical protein Ctob_012968, partial [Chrysochromulina tobinii]
TIIGLAARRLGGNWSTRDFESDIRRQQEEERLWALKKGRAPASSSLDAWTEVPTPAPVAATPAPWIELQHAPFESSAKRCESPGFAFRPGSPLLSTSEVSNREIAFLTRYSRRNNSSSAPVRSSPLGMNSVGPPCGARTSIPDRLLTPGPGTYEVDTRKAMASITAHAAELPSPCFRSRTGRFGGHLDTFGGADPLNLYPGAQAPRDRTPWQSPDATSFRRGRGLMSMAPQP